MKTPVVVGIDIGGTNSAFGMVDRNGSVLYKSSVPTGNFPTAEEMVEAVSGAVRREMKSDWTLTGAGIGAPNGNFYHGTIEHAPNLRWKGIVPLAGLFSKALGVPAALTNDANAAALGEMIFGGAKGMKDFIFITLGTGLGSGIVAGGTLIYGHDGFAGEIGHAIVVPNGRACGCGRKGCLETYCSATGIKRTVVEWLEKGESSSLGKIPPDSITARHIHEAAECGDALARRAFEFTGELLGLTLANSVVYTSPQAIFLFGGLANAGKWIFEPTTRHFEANLLNIFQNKARILPSRLPENDAAILGAASLIWQGK